MLVVGVSDNKWNEAFNKYYLSRLELRYLHPIKLLQENGTFRGEGFSIMAILCTMVEFLESTYQGKLYKYCPKGQKHGENEYSSSKSMFISFLVNRDPFRQSFDKKSSTEFYSSIRCGLLHEASTKNGWRIWAESEDGKILDEKQKIVFRNGFEEAIKIFISGYGKELVVNSDLQKAFILKFNSL